MNKCTGTAVSMTYSTVSLPKIPVVLQRLLVHLLHLYHLPFPVLTLTYSWVSHGTPNNTLQCFGTCVGIFVFTFLWTPSNLHAPSQTDIQDHNIVNSLAKTVSESSRIELVLIGCTVHISCTTQAILIEFFFFFFPSGKLWNSTFIRPPLSVLPHV
jgi:hypothetical protein